MPRVLALLLLFACIDAGIAQPVRAADASTAAQVDAAMALPEDKGGLGSSLLTTFLAVATVAAIAVA